MVPIQENPVPLLRGPPILHAWLNFCRCSGRLLPFFFWRDVPRPSPGPSKRRCAITTTSACAISPRANSPMPASALTWPSS